jgi:hypothetical protein
LINKTFSQLHAERAARRAEYEECQDQNNPGWREIHKYNKKIKLKKLVLKLNKENAPPDGWRPEDQVSSPQAGGPAPQKSGFKQP